MKHELACTFGLNPFTVGRDDNTLDLPEFEMFQHLSEAHDKPTLHPGLHGIFLIKPILKPHQFLQ